MTSALLDRLTHHCDIVETGNENGASRTGSDRSPIKPRTDPRSPRPRNPDQLRWGERYRCALRPNRGSILNADRG